MGTNPGSGLPRRRRASARRKPGPDGTQIVWIVAGVMGVLGTMGWYAWKLVSEDDAALAPREDQVQTPETGAPTP